jgi:hypothetical protein
MVKQNKVVVTIGKQQDCETANKQEGGDEGREEESKRMACKHNTTQQHNNTSQDR